MGYGGYEVIDCDGHVMEPFELYHDYIEAAYRDAVTELFTAIRAQGIASSAGINRLILGEAYRSGGRPLGVAQLETELARHEGFRHPETQQVDNPRDRLADMDREGIDIAVIFATTATSWCGLDDAGLEAALCRAYNRWLVDYCSTDPQRLKAVCVIPMRDIRLGVDELHRCAQAPTVVGMMSFMSLDDKLADHPEFDPIYQAAQDLDLPICIHGGADRPPYAPGRAELGNNHFLIQLTGQPWHTMRQMGAMIGGGVFDRFPHLRTAFLESGCGWIPWWMERMDEYIDLYQPWTPYMRHAPGHYMRGAQCFYSFDPDEAALEYAVQQLGEDRLMWASDYPHFDCRFPDSVKLVAERDTLSESVKRKLLSQNARRFYTRLGEPG